MNGALDESAGRSPNVADPPNGPGSTPARTPRYEALDGWRGLAALAVCLEHVAGMPSEYFTRGTWAPPSVRLGIGEPAVTLFFVISGYCIARSVQRREPWPTFMGRRLRRIWPPYLASLALLFILRIQAARRGELTELAIPIHSWIQNLTLTQWVSDASPFAHARPTWLNPVAWSLCYEEQFYIVMGALAVFARSRSISLLAPVAVLAVVSMAWNAAGGDGALFINLWLIFALGVAVYLLSDRARLPLVAGLCFFIVAAIIWLQFPCHNPRHAQKWPGTVHLDALPCLVAATFSLVLVVGRSASDRVMASPVGVPLRYLGKVSFSLYLTHYIVMQQLGTRSAVLFNRWNPPVGLWWCFQLLLHVSVASIFWWFCERPFARSNAGAFIANEDPTSQLDAASRVEHT